MKKTYLLRVMRLLILFWLAGLMQLSATTYSQTVTIEARNAQMADLFKIIRQQTGYAISGSGKLLKTTRPVTILANKMPLQEFLTEILADQSISFEITDNTVILKSDYNIGMQDDGIRIQGYVVDSLGNPLSGASVKIYSTGNLLRNLASMTDKAGRFVLDDVPKQSEVEISFLGHLTVNLPVRSDMGRIILHAQTSQLAEVMITKGVLRCRTHIEYR